MAEATDPILVIRLGALGDVVLSLGPMAAIRQHHPKARITLLTTRPYAAWLAKSPYFDEVWIDDRAPWWRPDRLLALRRRLIGGGFARVYDLQTSGRSSRYLKFWSGRAAPEWSGIAPGASHPDSNPGRSVAHTIDRQREQLRLAGIPVTPLTDLAWMKSTDLGRFNLPQRYALIIPGGSAHRPEKRWPVENYAKLARLLSSAGITPVIIGGGDERGLASTILTACPTARDLTTQTSFEDLVTLARSATLAAGNDTGPMHLIAATGTPGVVLFSRHSNPDLCAPRQPRMTILRRDDLVTLTVDEVFQPLEDYLVLAKPL
jgi:ADP-heptose:LPS heptosyltransferase